MITKNFPFIAALAILLSFSIQSCSSDDPVQVEVPSTYSFERDGSSTVSYSGQTQRLDMLDELMTYAKSGTGATLEEQKLLDMFSNENSPFSQADLNQTGDSRKQLASKLYGQGDGSTPVDGGVTVTYFENLFSEIATISADNATTAENGTAGTISSGTSTYLVNDKGYEPAQLIEKGLMVALLFHQGTNVYLGTEKLAVSGTELDGEKNYTSLEHHFDEAYGYFDFPTNMSNFDEMGANKELRYWAKYAYSRKGTDAIGYDIDARIHEAFRTARACIAAQYDHLDEDIDCSYNDAISTIQKEWELMVAANAIHYLNDAKGLLTDQAKLSHALSEGVGFLQGLAYANAGNSRMSDTDIATVKELIGTNLWEIVPANLDTAIDKIVEKYTELSDVKDQL